MNGDPLLIAYSEMVAWQHLTKNDLTVSDISLIEALDMIAVQPKGK